MPSLDATTKKTIAIVATVFLFVWGLSLFAQKIDLTTADLGRHIKNGELILNGSVEERRAVFTENFYSYTEPTHPFLNHHWGSGVLFYLIERVAGFGGLSLFFLLGIALSLFFCFHLPLFNLFRVASLSLRKGRGAVTRALASSDCRIFLGEPAHRFYFRNFYHRDISFFPNGEGQASAFFGGEATLDISLRDKFRNAYQSRRTCGRAVSLSHLY